jgi:glycosyltransferase involved in cell wall biosynthesis
MKILYLSCHSILEYDEVKLLSELGADVFSWGAYRDPSNPGEKRRPALDITVHKEFIDLTEGDNKENIPQELIDWADVVICMHVSKWLAVNWEKLKGKTVVLRTIGQNTLENEGHARALRYAGLKIIRYSPRERTIPGYAGEDALIRFYKDPQEFNNWNGKKKQVLTISQSMKDRENSCNYTFFKDATDGFPRVLYGTPSKQPDELWKGEISYDKMKQELRDSRVYFYTGTYPASYVLNFMEALMTGCPIVALGPLLGNSPTHPDQQTYEVADFSENDTNLLLADDIYTARKHISRLMTDDAFAAQISANARATALKYFDKEIIKAQWKQFLGL